MENKNVNIEVENGQESREKKAITVFSIRICEILITEGFLKDLIRIEPSKRNPKFRVWIFKYSEKLDKVFNEYCHAKNEGVSA